MQNTKKQKIKALIALKKIVTIEEIKKLFKIPVRMTIIRRLRELSYLTSYSHCGKYYTLNSVAKFSEEGLWSYNCIYFSKFYTLKNTCYQFINNSEAGYTVKELRKKLHVNVKQPLIELHKNNKLYREKYSGKYVYFNKIFPHRKQQIIIRRSQNETTVLNIGKLSSHVITRAVQFC